MSTRGRKSHPTTESAATPRIKHAVTIKDPGTKQWLCSCGESFSTKGLCTIHAKRENVPNRGATSLFARNEREPTTTKVKTKAVASSTPKSTVKTTESSTPKTTTKAVESSAAKEKARAARGGSKMAVEIVARRTGSVESTIQVRATPAVEGTKRRRLNSKDTNTQSASPSVRKSNQDRERSTKEKGNETRKVKKENRDSAENWGYLPRRAPSSSKEETESESSSDEFEVSRPNQNDSAPPHVQLNSQNGVRLNRHNSDVEIVDFNFKPIKREQTETSLKELEEDDEEMLKLNYKKDMLRIKIKKHQTAGLELEQQMAQAERAIEARRRVLSRGS